MIKVIILHLQDKIFLKEKVMALKMKLREVEVPCYLLLNRIMMKNDMRNQ